MSRLEPSPELDRRLPWFFLAMAAWMLGLRAWVTGVANGCAVDPAVLGRRSGWILDYLQCSPRLLFGGLGDFLLFVFTWAGTLLTAAFMGYLVLRIFRSPSHPKES